MIRRSLLLLIFLVIQAQCSIPQLTVESPSQIIVNQYLELKIQTNIQSTQITYVLNDYSFALEQTDFGWQSRQLITPELCPPGIYDLKIFVHLSDRQDYLQAEELMKRGIGEILKGKLYISRRLLVLPQQQQDPLTLKVYPQPVKAGELLTIVATIPTQTVKVVVAADEKSWTMEHLDGFDYLLQFRPEKNLQQLNISVETLSKKLLSKIFYIKMTEDLKVSDNQNLADTIEQSVSQNFFELSGQKSVAFRSTSFNGDSQKKSIFKREEFLEVYVKGREDQIQLESEVYISDSQYFKDNDYLKLKLFTDNWQLFFGDFYETVSYLTVQQKKLKGIYYVNNQANLKISTTKSPGNNYSEYIYGNDSQGPFSLSFKSILIDSETITKKGRKLVRGTDYYIDYSQGKITLINDLLKREDTIFVSYQYYSGFVDNQLNYWTYEKLFGKQYLRAGYFELKKSQQIVNSSNYSSNDGFENEKIYSLATSLNYNKFKFYLEHNDTGSCKATDQANDFRINFEDDNKFLQFTNRYVGKNYPCFGNTQLQSGVNQYLLDLALKNIFYLDYNQKDNFLLDQKQTLILSDFCFNNFSWLHQQQYLDFCDLSDCSARTYQKDQLKFSYPLTTNFNVGIGGEKELLQDEDLQKYNNGTFTFLNLKTKNNFDFSAEAKTYYIKRNDRQLNAYENYRQQDLRLKMLIAQLRNLRLNLSYFNSFNDFDGNRDVLSLDLVNKYFIDLKSNYRINNLNETYNNQTFKIRKVRGLLSVKANPVNFIQLKYDFKPAIDYLPAQDNLINLKDISNIYLLDFYLLNFSCQYQLFNNRLTNRDPFTAKIRKDFWEQTKGILLKTSLNDQLDLEFYQKETNSEKLELIVGNNLQLTKINNFLWGINNYWRITSRWLLIGEYSCGNNEIHLPTDNRRTREISYRLQSDYQLASSLIWKLFGQKKDINLERKYETFYSAGSGLGYQWNSLNVDLSWQLTNGRKQNNDLKNDCLNISLIYQPQSLINLTFGLQRNNFYSPRRYQELACDFKLVLKF